MAEILHFEILRKHGQTHRQTDRHGHYNTSPSPYGGRGNYDQGKVRKLYIYQKENAMFSMISVRMTKYSDWQKRPSIAKITENDVSVPSM